MPGDFNTVRSALSPASAKKMGAKKDTTIARNRSSMCLVRIGDSPTRIPATKAPSTVWTPSAWVMSAIPPMMIRIRVMTGNSLFMKSLTKRIERRRRAARP